jgi:hypothetical protein
MPSFLGWLLAILTLAPVWTELVVTPEPIDGTVEAADGGSSFPEPKP